MNLNEAVRILRANGCRLLKEVRERIPCFLDCGSIYLDCNIGSDSYEYFTAEGVQAYSNFVGDGDSRTVEPENLRFHVDTWYDDEGNEVEDSDLIYKLEFELKQYLLSPANIDKWRVHSTGIVQLKKPEVIETLEDAGFRVSAEGGRQDIYLGDKAVGWLNDREILLRPGNGEMPLHLEYHLVNKAARQYLMATIQKMTGGV